MFFAFQIYCDFSGYSDIAVGAARVMGFRLMENFNAPYMSTSISDFWKRWHISLSSWFRDYLYISLGGNRVSKPRWLLNLFLTFLISGLWHGANWTFIAWGAINGTYLHCLDLDGKLENPGCCKAGADGPSKGGQGVEDLRNFRPCLRWVDIFQSQEHV